MALGSAIEYEIASHDDEDDVWEFAGIASYESNNWMLGFNVIGERQVMRGADFEWGYALGARRVLTHKVAAGFEVAGTFEDDREGEVLLGIFITPIPRLTVNVGIGTGFNGGADLSFRSALVFRFR